MSALAANDQIDAPGSNPRRRPPLIRGAPRVRQMYWCAFWADSCLPEMCKTRPVVVMSYKNTLHGPCLVVPTSTDPQEGASAKWAHKLSFQPDGRRDSWVVCNHLYTVSCARLAPLSGANIPRIDEDEFNEILARVHQWLPQLPA